jgi:lipid A 3-O-deacylase
MSRGFAATVVFAATIMLFARPGMAQSSGTTYGFGPLPQSGNFVDEVKAGILAHDVRLFGQHVESGADVNLEMLFVSPDLLSVIGSPRPEIGVDINTAGNTSNGYLGLTWGTSMVRNLFNPGDSVWITGSLGGALQDGYELTAPPGRKRLGSPILFHLESELGYQITPVISVSAVLDHISNANTAPRNAGITSAGLRVGFKFDGLSGGPGYGWARCFTPQTTDSCLPAFPALFSSPPSTSGAPSAGRTPDLVSFGTGYLGVIKTAQHVSGGDLRGEYRWGISLLSLISPYFEVLDPYFQIHPALGAEVTTRGALYGEYSFIFDIPIGDHFFVGWDEGMGYLVPAGGQPKGGSSIEFRTQFETGWRFDNGVRVAGWLGHISNDHANNTRYSGDSIGAYLHLPVGMLFR